MVDLYKMVGIQYITNQAKNTQFYLEMDTLRGFFLCAALFELQQGINFS